MPNAPINFADVHRVLGRKFSKTGDTIYAPAGTTSDILTAQIATSASNPTPKSLLKLTPAGFLQYGGNAALLWLSVSQVIANGVTATCAFDTIIFDSGSLGDTTNHVINLPSQTLRAADKSMWIIGACIQASNVAVGFGWVINLQADIKDGNGFQTRTQISLSGSAPSLATLVTAIAVANGQTGQARVQGQNATGGNASLLTQGSAISPIASTMFAAYVGNTSA